MIPPGGQSGRQEGCKARNFGVTLVRYLDIRVYLFRHVMCIILILQTNYIYILYIYIHMYIYIYTYICTEYCTHMEMYVEKLLTMGWLSPLVLTVSISGLMHGSLDRFGGKVGEPPPRCTLGLIPHRLVLLNLAACATLGKTKNRGPPFLVKV